MRALVIGALLSERVRHERRAGVGEKNLLYTTEEVNPDFVIHLLRRCPAFRLPV